MAEFSGKILLFGEYTVLNGGKALAGPLPEFSGHLTSFDFDEKLFDVLIDFSNYLAKNCPYIDALRLVKNIELNGLSFDGNLPIGYGIGSSGVITAAIYAQFKTSEAKDENDLQNRLAQMEAFFHGKSSGFDPLVSYLNHWLVQSHGNIEKVTAPKLNNLKTYIIDSGVPRSTAKCVNLFQQLALDDSILNEWKALSEFCIDSALNGNDLNDALKALSTLQLKYLKPLIPKEVELHWQQGISENLYYTKLCGAGGGGFFLSFADEEQSQEMFQLKSTQILKD